MNSNIETKYSTSDNIRQISLKSPSFPPPLPPPPPRCKTVIRDYVIYGWPLNSTYVYILYITEGASFILNLTSANGFCSQLYDVCTFLLYFVLDPVCTVLSHKFQFFLHPLLDPIEVLNSSTIPSSWIACFGLIWHFQKRTRFRVNGNLLDHSTFENSSMQSVQCPFAQVL